MKSVKTNQLKTQTMTKNTTMQRRKTVNYPTTRPSSLGKLRLLAIAMGAQALLAQASLAATLDHMSYTTLPSNQQQIAFRLSESVSNPQTFQIDSPAKIAIDLMGTTNALDKRVVPVGVGNIESVDIVEANDRTRIVLNLAEMTGYQTEIDGDRLLVTLDGDTDAQGSTNEIRNGGFVPDAIVNSGETFLQTASDVTITDNELPLAVTELVETSDVFEEVSDEEILGDGLVVELPSSLPIDFEAPEALPDAGFNVETGAPIEEYIDRAVPTTTEYLPETAPRLPRMDKSEFNSDTNVDYGRQTPEVFNTPPIAKKSVSYNGEELSLNFQDIEIRSVLQLLADFTDLNIVVSDTVEGKLTLRLKNVPWDQALDIILRTKGLDKRRSGNVVMVAPAAEIAAQEALEREAEQQAIALEPLRTEFVQVNYAKANEVAAILKSETGGVLSERGNVTIDDRTNTILVNDTSEVLGKVRALVTRLDVPVRQVLIESRIVIATDDFNRELGARFGINRSTVNTNGTSDTGIIASGNQLGVADALAGNTPGDGRFNVNLPASAPSGTLGLAFAKLPFGTLLELELSAMQAEGRGEVVSTPRIITANQHEAYIEQGVEIPFQEAASSGATSTSFRKAVLGLTVKPQITPDESIIIDLTVNKDTVGEISPTGVPSINTREVNTQVLVANGETVVLGGIYEQTYIQQRNQVPFFGDLPLVGKLFQQNIAQDDKSELLVFVTPKIVADGTSSLDR